MYRFWDTIIQPVLELLRPETIVEIGSEYGQNTQKLLAFCQRNDAKLHVIDPLPKYDVAAWQEEYGEHLIFHKALSLYALPKIDWFDAVLIDGDHNWYTVFSELKLMEERCEASSRPFPLVMLHDVGWPYGRRDGYYNPSTIPDKYRKQHAKKGMRPGVAHLVKKRGLNENMANAISENEPRNGVLTAVEDFVRETKQEIELIKLPGLHGLGLLVPLRLEEQNAELAQFLGVLNLSPPVARYIEMIEDVRLNAEIDRHVSNAIKDENKVLASENRRLKRQLENIKNSRSWKLITVLGLMRARLLGR
jgi:hypothetical protein